MSDDRDALRRLDALTPERLVSEPVFCTECNSPEGLPHVAGCSRPWWRMRRDVRDVEGAS